MNNLTELRLNLIGNIIKDFLNKQANNDSNIIYKEVFNHTYKKIRFTTNTLVSIFGTSNNKSEKWNNNYISMYEITYENSILYFECVVDYNLYKKDKINNLLSLDICIGVEDLTQTLKSIFECELVYFEKELLTWKDNNSHPINSLDLEYEKLWTINELPEEFLVEGNVVEVYSNKYERNIEARKQCLAYYGFSCQICGFDFGKVYGQEFKYQIHVHHIVPISEIKEEYVVDPIKDLIPVCPNCHMALHSKQNGVYTPTELKNKINKKGE